MNVRQKLSLAALCIALPALASAQAAPAPAAEPAAAPAAAPAPALEVKPYGFVLLTYNQSNGTFKYPEYPAVIASDMGIANIVSARQSRFGFTIKNADSGVLGAKLSGKMEADFMGTSDKLTDSVVLRLRYAVASAVWNNIGPGNVTLTLGQTDGLVNALHPELGAYIALPTFMLAGNLTRRSPQIRAGYDFAAGPVALNIEAAALQAIDKGGTEKFGDIPLSAGAQSGNPDWEAHLGAVVKATDDIKISVGAGYHTNKRTYKDTASAKETELTATLFGVDANLEITKYLNLRGEYFNGNGSDESQTGAFGSTTGAVSSDDLKLVKTNGFWAQAVVKVIPQVWVIAGMGQTKNPDAKTTYSMGNYGVLAPVGKNLRLGLEYTTSGKDVDGTKISGSQVAFSSRFTF